MMHSTYSWLPDHHLSVAATLSHAEDQIEQVSELLFDYQTQPDGVLGLAAVQAGANIRTVVDRVAPIPRKVALLAADALLTLRSALEHVLFAETEHLDGSPLGERAARLVEMPAAETTRAFDEWRSRRQRHGPPSLCPGGELARRIEALQPFHLRSDPQAHPLARLALHTNHAKHRMPAVAAVRLAAMYEDHQIPRSLSELRPQPDVPVRVGDVDR